MLLLAVHEPQLSEPAAPLTHGCLTPRERALVLALSTWTFAQAFQRQDNSSCACTHHARRRIMRVASLAAPRPAALLQRVELWPCVGLGWLVLWLLGWREHMGRLSKFWVYVVVATCSQVWAWGVHSCVHSTFTRFFVNAQAFASRHRGEGILMQAEKRRHPHCRCRCEMAASLCELEVRPAHGCKMCLQGHCHTGTNVIANISTS